MKDPFRDAALRDLEILDTPPEEDFDDITRLVAKICETPVATISLIEADRQWFKSRVGLPVSETSSDVSICKTALESKVLFVVPDLLADDRYKDNPLVNQPGGFRFYAGAVLRTDEGVAIGTLCVLDTKPRFLTESQRDAIVVLSKQVMTQMKTRKLLRTQAIDAEDRQRLVARLEDAQTRLKTTLSSAEVATWIWHIPENQVLADKNLARLFDIAPEDAHNAPVERYLEAVHPEDRPHVEGAIAAVMSGRSNFNIEYRLMQSDGSVRWVLARGTLERDSAGEPLTLPGLILDITERKLIELRLSENKAKLQFLNDLGEATRDTIDPEQVMAVAVEMLGRHMHVSRCAYAEVDSDTDGFFIRHDYTDNCPSTVGRYRLDLFGRRAAADQREGRTLVVSDVDKEMSPEDGADTFNAIGIKAIICCPLIKRGKLAAMMAVHSATPRQWTHTDVLLVEAVVERSWAFIERARVSRDLQQANRTLQLAQEAGGVGTFDYRIPEGVVVWSPALERLYGVAEGTFEGSLNDWNSRVEPQDAERIIADMAQCMAQRQTDYRYEFRAILPNGKRRWLLGQAQFLYDAAGQAVRMIGVNVDVHEQREAAEHREQLLDSERAARSEAERVSRMKDEFLATLSHELRTPLNAIFGWAQILRFGPNDPAELAQGLETIERNARAQAQIIEDLLDMSRIISGKIRLDVQRLDLAAVLQAAVETVRPAATAKEIRLQTVIDPQAGAVSGDPNRLQQVFWNLLSNAIKFTPRQGRVQLILERVNSHVEITVNDSGEGIAAEFLPYVFDRFRQADASTTRAHGGLGLGLAIAKQLVELHGGSVRAASAGLGHGSSFTVMLPVTVIHTGPSESHRRHPKAGGGLQLDIGGCTDIAGLKVLVVDDEPDAREIVKRLLEECHAQVTAVGSAAEAFEHVQKYHPDVLVSDIGMPDEDGHTLIRRIRTLSAVHGGATPAVALTAYARSEDRMRAVLAGFQMHMAKPVEPAELITIVASLGGRTGRT